MILQDVAERPGFERAGHDHRIVVHAEDEDAHRPVGVAHPPDQFEAGEAAAYDENVEVERCHGVR